MDTLSQIAGVLFAVFLIWMLVRYIRTNPEALSFSNINKSLFTLGLMGVGLIVFIGIIVFLLRQT